MNDDDEEATPPEEWALEQYNSTGSRHVYVTKLEKSKDRGRPVVYLSTRRAGKSRENYGLGTLITHLTVDEAEAYATLLMYQAQQIRKEQEDTP